MNQNAKKAKKKPVICEPYVNQNLLKILVHIWFMSVRLTFPKCFFPKKNLVHIWFTCGSCW